MDSNAESVSFGHGPPPAALVRDEFDHFAKSGGIDGVAVVGLAVVPKVFDGREINDPRRADELQQHVLLVSIGGVRKLADHGLHGKGVRDVRYRTEPADAGIRGRFRVLALDVCDLERHVDKSHAEFEGRLMHRAGRKGRGDAGSDAAVPPRDHLAVLVKASLDAFRGHGVEEAVTDVVVPRPLHLHRRAELF